LFRQSYFIYAALTRTQGTLFTGDQRQQCFLKQELPHLCWIVLEIGNYTLDHSIGSILIELKKSAKLPEPNCQTPMRFSALVAKTGTGVSVGAGGAVGDGASALHPESSKPKPVNIMMLFRYIYCSNTVSIDLSLTKM